MTLNEYLNPGQYSIEAFIEGGTYGNLYVVKDIISQKIYQAEISRYNISIRLEEPNNFLKKEISIMSGLNHPSFLKFIGFSPNGFQLIDRPTIITEYFKSQSLEEIIKISKTGQFQNIFDDTKKLIIIYGIASGMAYLHKHGVVHGNLNSKTILIDDFFHPKIIYSKILQIIGESCKNTDEYDDTSSLCIFPEELICNLNSKEDDVRSFSLILYQILNGRKIRPKQNKPYQFNQNVPYVYQKLFEKCNSDEEIPTFENIIDLLINDFDFITEKVDSKIYYRYVAMIEECQTQEINIKTFDYEKNQYMSICKIPDYEEVQYIYKCDDDEDNQINEKEINNNYDENENEKNNDDDIDYKTESKGIEDNYNDVKSHSICNICQKAIEN